MRTYFYGQLRVDDGMEKIGIVLRMKSEVGDEVRFLLEVIPFDRPNQSIVIKATYEFSNLDSDHLLSEDKLL